MPKPEFRRKFSVCREIAKKPERIRDGTVQELVNELALRDGEPAEKYWGYFLDMAAVLVPGHGLLSKRETTDANAILSTLQRGREIKANVLKEAVRHHLNEQLAQTFVPERVERMTAMVDYLYRNRAKIRKDALLDFQQEWNTGREKGKHVSYDALKKDLTALSYAYVGVGKKETDESHVVEDHLADFRRAVALKHQNVLDIAKAREVCKVFMDLSVEGEFERLRRDTLLLKRQGVAEHYWLGLDEVHKELAEVAVELYRLRKSEPNVHAATAANTVWKEVGYPLRAVVPRVNSAVYSMFELADRKTLGKEAAVEDFGLPIDPHNPAALAELEGTFGIVPRHPGERGDSYETRKQQKAAEEVLTVWFTHLHRAKATLSYERARHALKGQAEHHAEIGWGHGTKFRGLVKKTKSVLKAARLGKRAEAGWHLRDGDALWSRYKRLEDNNPFLGKRK